MIGAIRRIWHDEQGATTVEYAMLLVVVVIGSIGAWSALSQRVGDVCSAAANAVAGE